MEFSLLGDVRVRLDGRAVDVGHARQRAVLVVLLVEANRVVPDDELVDRVWGEHRLPARPARALQTYVSLLRSALAAGGGGATIARRAGGYQLRVPEEAVDLHRFRALTERAHGAGDETAAELLERALGLWRGEPFPSLDTPWLNLTRSVLDGERHAARYELAEAYLRLGRHDELLVRLVEWVQRHPLDERLAAQYLVALYRAGRRAEAIAYYDEVRRRLAEQLGTDPGAELRALHRRLLTDDPALEAPASRLPPPRQLPTDTAHFTGRRAELAALDRAAEERTGDGSAVVIAAVHGCPGAGKTTLAVHWALRAGHRFPDGQLYANLRGFDPSDAPLSPSEVLDGFLRALNVAEQQIPPELEARATLFRSLVAGRRVLVFLDNAATVEQVRPLLPGSSPCVVVITSRNRLAGLAAREGVRRIGVGSLPEPDAVELLRTIVGPARADAEPGALPELARRCECLPLALRIAAERVAAHPHTPLAGLVRELADVRRLDVLSAEGEESGAVRAVFSWSYRRLTPAAARAFRLLSLHPGPEVGRPAAAALLGAPARTLLDALVGAHLLEETGPDRFGLHDLLRAYAAECAAADEPEQSRAAAVRRTLAWYLHTADAAARAFSPAGVRPGLAPPEPGCAPLSFERPDQALRWCESELPNLVAATAAARSRGEHATAWRLPVILWEFFSRRKHWSDWIATHLAGLAAAEECGDRTGEGWVLNTLGPAYRDLKRYGEALDCFQRALRIWQETGQRVGQGWTLYNIGDTLRETGRLEEAIEYLTRSLAISRESGVRWGEGWALAMLGDASRRLGRPADALRFLHQSLRIRQEAGDDVGRAVTLTMLGHVHRDLGNLPEALRFFRRSLLICRQSDQPQLEARNLLAIGDALRDSDRAPEARESWGDALAAFERIGDPHAAEAGRRLRGPAALPARYLSAANESPKRGRAV
jgi:DNA-binding SARP family transcriptional activator